MSKCKLSLKASSVTNERTLSHRLTKLGKIGTRTRLAHQFSKIVTGTHTKPGFFWLSFRPAVVPEVTLEISIVNGQKDPSNRELSKTSKIVGRSTGPYGRCTHPSTCS